MTDEELRKNVIECMRLAHFMDYAFIHGDEYVIKHRAWIDWEFERKLKRMTNVDWEKVINGYIEASKEVKTMNDDIMNVRHVNCASVDEYCREHDLVLVPRERYNELVKEERKLIEAEESVLASSSDYPFDPNVPEMGQL